MKNMTPTSMLHFKLASLELGPGLADLVGPNKDGPLARRVESIQRHLASEFGILAPDIHFSVSDRLEVGDYVIYIREIPVARSTVNPGKLLAVGPPAVLEKLKGETTVDPTYGLSAKWVPANTRQSDDYHLFDNVNVLATHLTRTLRVHANELLGLDEVQRMLDLLDRPVLLDEAIPELLTLVRLRAVLGKLLDEQVSIRDLGLIVRTLAEYPDYDNDEATEMVRQALRASISHDNANAEGEIRAIVLKAVGEKLHDEEFLTRLNGAIDEMNQSGLRPTVITSAELRMELRALFADADVVCLSDQEIHPRYRVVDYVTLE